MRKSVFESKVRELKELERQKELLESHINVLKDELKCEMDKKSKYEYSGADWKLTWKLVSSNRFDQSSFKLDHPRLYKKYQRVSESRRFLLY